MVSISSHAPETVKIVCSSISSLINSLEQNLSTTIAGLGFKKGDHSYLKVLPSVN